MEPASDNSPNADNPPSQKVRWWLAGVILVLTALPLVMVWGNPDLQLQNKHLATLIIGFCGGVSLLAWFAFWSRLPRALRMVGSSLVVGLVALATVVFFVFFEIRGFTGDFLPIVEVRSMPRDSERMVAGNPLPSAPPVAESLSIQPTAADFPQFLGPTRNCLIKTPSLVTDWSAHPPTQIWRRELGPAWSGFAVVGSVAVTQEQRGDKEMVVAYDLKTGAPVWSHEDEAHYLTKIAGEGPRATPTISEGKVFTHGGTGILNCLDLATGRKLWSAASLKNPKDVPQWGASSSPLVVSNLVVVCASGGKSLIAFNREDGHEVWTGGTDNPSYSSPFLLEVAGVSQIVSFNDASVSGHNPETGEVFWSHPWNASQPKVAMPLVLPGDRLHFSSGYGVGSQLFQITKGEAGKLSIGSLWKTIKMKAKFTNLASKDGYIYGMDDGIMACQDAATGELKWKDGRYGHGQILFNGELLIATCETGEVVLVKPSPDGLHELGKFSAFTDKTWNPPALVGDLLLIRNHKEAACYKLPTLSAKPPPSAAR